MRYVLIGSWSKIGSTGKIAYNYYSYLKEKGQEVHFFYSRGETNGEKDIIQISDKKNLYLHGALARLTGKQGFFSTKETKKLIEKIKIIKPDCVYLFNLHAYYLNEFLLLDYLKKSGVNTVYMLFDEYPYLGKCCFSEGCEKFKTECKKCPKIHEYPKSLIFDRSNLIFIKKKETYAGWENLHFAGVKYIGEQAKQSALAKNIPFHSFNMGIDLSGLYYPRDTHEIVEKYNIPVNKRIVLTVGFSSDARKGIKKYIEIARKCKDVLFINIGYDKNICVDPPANFFPIKYVGNQLEMACFYTLADAYVTTSSGEAMSNACLESLACGTPIIGFNVSRMSYLAPAPIGTYIPYDNIDSFAEAISNLPKKNDEISTMCRKYAENHYDLKEFMKNLYQISETMRG